jgi:hypothetical protein
MTDAVSPVLTIRPAVLRKEDKKKEKNHHHISVKAAAFTV